MRMRLKWRDIAETIILTVVIFLLVRASAENFRVEGRSMEPTLSNGQFILINKIGYWRIDRDLINTVFPDASEPVGDGDTVYLFAPPQRGDVIVFQYPRDPNKAYIKRVIGIPGDTVEIVDGRVILNGMPLEEDYLFDEPRYESPPREVRFRLLLRPGRQSQQQLRFSRLGSGAREFRSRSSLAFVVAAGEPRLPAGDCRRCWVSLAKDRNLRRLRAMKSR